MAKTARLEVRVEPENLERLKEAARSAGLSVSAWAGERLLLCANQELVTVPPFVAARELAANLPGVREPDETIPTGGPGAVSWEAPKVEGLPSIDPADEALVQEALGINCILCGEVGHVVPADWEAFNAGSRGPSNLQVLCDECTAGAGDLRDHEHLDAIQEAVQQPNSP